MSVYDNRLKPAYGFGPRVGARDEKNSHILKWWTAAHDDAIQGEISKWQWQWPWGIKDKIELITPPATLEAWRRDDPACHSHAWYNVLMYFCIARVATKGYDKVIRQPLLKHCLLCGLQFREDFLPYPLVLRLGIDQIDFCSPCLQQHLLKDGDGHASLEDVSSYLRKMTQAISRIPPSDFGHNITDLHGMTNEERLAVLRVLDEKPSLKRVKELFGSWLNALIQAHLLEDDVRRTLRGIQCIANDGHVCLSLGEKTIDDMLFALGVEHEKEPRYPNSNFRADFRVGKIFIEYFGMARNEAYDERAKEKVLMCANHSIKLIAIYPKDLSSVKSLSARIIKEISAVKAI